MQKNTNIANVGLNLMYFRKVKGLSINDVASKLNMNSIAYSRYEQGLVNIPLNKLIAICKILDLDLILQANQ
ncbi:helix-turn-helix domain-containing protein [Streptobacillus moniliformis]|uniref:helix-turn-helix domain-containing protein n=1 Tax=Streptobacillus moniliformis TaxID=34105 RepID=UPI0007E2DDD2|nr:helix-turn-helix transcriptional regulator [Streptobacillus moniliformis]